MPNPRATRKPLSKVSANTALPKDVTQTKSEDIIKPMKEDKEKEDLKALVAELSSKLEKTELSEKPTFDLSAVKDFNPFNPVSFTPSVSVITKPKRAVPALLYYQMENRQAVRDAHPGESVAEITSRLNIMWKDASDDEKAPFIRLSEQDRIRYEAEKADYDKKLADNEKERKAVDFMNEKMKQEDAMKLYEQYVAKHSEKTKADHTSAELQKPKQARNAYVFFSSARHEELAKSNPEEKLSAADVRSKIAEEWKSLGTSRKKKDKAMLKKFHELAREDQLRYETETTEYEKQVAEIAAQAEEQQEEYKRRAVDEYSQYLKQQEQEKVYRKIINETKQAEAAEKKAVREEKKAAREAKAAAPKRPRNAYMLFFAETATKVTAEINSGTLKDVTMAAEVSRRWKAATEKDKEPYQKLAADDRVRYENEMEAFKAQGQQ